MIYCPELNKEFTDKSEMFSALKRNAEKIISLKKANIFKSHDKGAGVSTKFSKETNALKGHIENSKANHVYAVINTTNYFDSHGDVHFKGIWDKSASEQNGKIFYVADHSLKIDDVIAWKSDVNIIVQELDWAAVGKNFEGTTQALIFEIPVDKIMHQKALEVIEAGKDVENSVRMQYVQIKLAVNSTDSDYKEEKANYDSLINSIANKDDVEKNGYFWAVNEAKIYKEGSMVTFGSNDATSIETIKDNKQPLQNTDENEPLDNNQEQKESKKRIQL